MGGQRTAYVNSMFFRMRVFWCDGWSVSLYIWRSLIHFYYILVYEPSKCLLSLCVIDWSNRYF